MNNAMMKPVGQFAPLIGRRQHHYASQIFQLMFMQVLTQHNAAQGMGYKMDFRCWVTGALLEQIAQPMTATSSMQKRVEG